MASQTSRGSDAFEAAKSAIYLYGLRHEYSGRIGEHDRFTHRGAEGALEYIRDQIDVTRPTHAFWGDVLTALQNLENGYAQQEGLW